MKNLKLIIISGIVLFFLVIAVLVFAFTLNRKPELVFQVIDKNSKAWVWDATITLQDRVIRGYYQTDAGAGTFKFTNLKTGPSTLRVSAPFYEEVSVPVTIKRRTNTLSEPIVLEGYELPGFERFYIFTKQDGSDLISEMRPVTWSAEDERHVAIINHPCVNLWIGCKIYTQVRGGIYVSEPTETGSETGELLFKDTIRWIWDASTDNVYRYTARITGTKIKKHMAPYNVHQYLIIVPDYRKMSWGEIDKEIRPLLDLEDDDELKARLDLYVDKFEYYFDTLWNVKALK